MSSGAVDGLSKRTRDRKTPAPSRNVRTASLACGKDGTEIADKSRRSLAPPSRRFGSIDLDRRSSLHNRSLVGKARIPPEPFVYLGSAIIRSPPRSGPISRHLGSRESGLQPAQLWARPPGCPTSRRFGCPLTRIKGRAQFTQCLAQCIDRLSHPDHLWEKFVVQRGKLLASRRNEPFGLP